MPVFEIEEIGDPRLSDYRHVPDPALLRQGEIFVAEGREVVRTLIARSRYTVRSVLLTATAYRALQDAIAPRLDGLTVYLVTPGSIETLTGYNIHRGCLAIGERPAPRRVETLLSAAPGARRLIVLEAVGNADNLGGIFRNAAAFRADGVVLGPGCCDPLYRKAIRVSMGTALLVPFASAFDWPADLEKLRAAGFQVAALTPAPGALDIAAAVSLASDRVALLAGAEGEGLTDAALAAADLRVRIPMAPGIDSINVATATGIALHRYFTGG